MTQPKRGFIAPRPAGRRVERDRFNAGEWVVKDGRGAVLASGFESEAEAQTWVDGKGAK